MQMCTYINFFSACHYIALTASVKNSKFVQVVPKLLGMNKFVSTKSHTGSKFSKTSLGFLCTRDCSCAPILQFFCAASAGATAARQIQNLIFGQFFTNLRKDSVSNYASIWTMFSKSVTGPDVLCNALNNLQIRRQVAPQDSQIYGGNLAKRKNSAAELCEILRIVTIQATSWI